MGKEKYLYHYTNFVSGMSILKSGSLRMFDAKQQSDPYEVIYAGNKIFEFFLDIISNQNNSYKKEQMKIFIGLLMFISVNYADETKQEKIQNSIKQITGIDVDNFFVQLNKDINSRIIRNFISSFTTSFNNKYLWDVYASNGAGIVIKIKSDCLQSLIGIKQVHYLLEEFIHHIIIEVTDYYTKSEIDKFELLGKLNKEITHVCLSTKQVKYSLENEIRLIEHYDCVTDEKIIEIAQNDKEFVLLPLTKQKFIKIISSIYYTDQLQLDKLERLISFQKKHPKIELIQIPYNKVI
ncbi:MAG: DUF2971 domain-containing protein [bacterium]